MNWKLLGIIAGVAGLGAVIASAAEAKGDDTSNGGAGTKSGRERARKAIREYFTVSGDCSIAFEGNAEQFWNRFDGYIKNMIVLAATIGVTDQAGVASYILLALFPECDQTKDQTLSFVAVANALEFRVSALMG